jgi:DNA-binding transcriptional MerR regulator
MILLAPRDVARRLKLSTSRVVQLDREGVLRARRDSAGRRFYDSEVVEQFARTREQHNGAMKGKVRAGEVAGEEEVSM